MGSSMGSSDSMGSSMGSSDSMGSSMGSSDSIGSSMGSSSMEVVISCDMTLDNVVTHVRYDGVDLEVEGPLDMWTHAKHFSFTPVPGAVLEIGGYEGASCNGCECSGLIVECSNGLSTNLDDWEAIGSVMSVVGPTSGYGDVCQSTSGMFLSGQTSDAVKIWPSNGEKYAWFRVIPEPGTKGHQAAARPGISKKTRRRLQEATQLRHTASLHKNARSLSMKL